MLSINFVLRIFKMSNSNNIWSVQNVYPCLPLFEYVKRAIGGFQQSFSFYVLCSSVDPPLFLISNSWQIGQRARIASEIRFFSRFWYVRFSHFSVNFFLSDCSFFEEVQEACSGPVIREKDGRRYRMTWSTSMCILS